MNNEAYKLSINEFRLNLDGNCCEECRPVCKAICCRYPWSVKLAQDEFLTGQYDASQLCLLSNKICENSEITCEFRSYQIKKKEDGSCIYLDHKNQCEIYDNRPLVCQEAICSYTFRISPVMQRQPLDTKDPSLNENFVIDFPEITEVLIPHPLIRLVSVIYSEKSSRLIFIKERIGNCGKFFTDIGFDYPQLSEEQIVQLIRLFDRKERLNLIFKEFTRIYAAPLKEPEFLEIVGLLLKHNIILRASNLFHVISIRQ